MEKPDSPLWKRLAWRAGIWLSSVLALGIAVGVLRQWLQQSMEAVTPACMVARLRPARLRSTKIGAKW